ncbi:MAG: glutamyl-tRNA reductase [Candidatus Sericytochromatia bacterium]|nr:glutamyl-tRNA reductase [Candidatus Tanganyikabacteria bacterium]
MPLLLIGLSHDTTPVALRERLAFSGPDAATALATWHEEGVAAELALISTCNRTEVYAVGDDADALEETLVAALARSRELPEAQVRGLCRVRRGDEAVLHLVRVASGLESQILGEGQILGQVREASMAARRMGTLGPVLDALFRTAIQAGRRVRTETAIAQGAVSVGAAAVELAREHLGGYRGRTVLVIGTGKIGELALRQLSSEQPARILIANRTPESAQALAEPFGAEAVPFPALAGALQVADVVLCCTGAPHHVLYRADIAPIMAARAGRPLLLLDVSVPRNLDPEMATLPGVALFDIDALTSLTERNRADRATWLPAAETIVLDAAQRFHASVQIQKVGPTIAALRDMYESVRHAELTRFLERHGATLAPDQVSAITELTRVIGTKFLHVPTVGLRHHAEAGADDHARVIQELFGLTDSVPASQA